MARKIYGIYKDDLPACIGTEKRKNKAFKEWIYNRKNM